jgi:NADH-quinone oxidoreductase subunit J
MVLFLFVIMLMNLNAEAEPPQNIYLKMIGAIAGSCLMIVFVTAFAHAPTNHTALRIGTGVGLIKNLGKTLFNQYVVPFEISSILFLSAMIGAVVLGKKEKSEGV